MYRILMIALLGLPGLALAADDQQRSAAPAADAMLLASSDRDRDQRRDGERDEEKEPGVVEDFTRERGERAGRTLRDETASETDREVEDRIRKGVRSLFDR